MEDQLITRKTIKLLILIGFNIKDHVALGKLKQPHNWHKDQKTQEWNEEVWYFDITQSLVQKYLREEHNTSVWLERKSNYWFIRISNLVIDKFRNGFDSYEEALELALQEAIEIIKS